MIIAMINADSGDALGLGQLLRTWSVPIVPLVALVLALSLYLRGWRVARVTR